MELNTMEVVCVLGLALAYFGFLICFYAFKGKRPRGSRPRSSDPSMPWVITPDGLEPSTDSSHHGHSSDHGHHGGFDGGHGGGFDGGHGGGDGGGGSH